MLLLHHNMYDLVIVESDEESEDLTSSAEISEMPSYKDVFRRKGSNVTFTRHYEKDDGVVVLRNQQFDPGSKVCYKISLLPTTVMCYRLPLLLTTTAAARLPSTSCYLLL